ncbi:MAG TPA: hypothetical protein VFD32_03275 [Dehalococcoidia bacterium]|nr:hypothetical protein [Dehalococcoidia bacterium]
MSTPPRSHTPPARDHGEPANKPAPQHLSADDEELDAVDAESADSFPASDPPSTSVPTTLGAEGPRGKQSRH